MRIKLNKARKFKFLPMYYQPLKDEDDDDQPRIKFRGLKSSIPIKKRSVIVMVVLAAVLLYLMTYWLKVDSTNKEFKFEEIKIEEIQ